MRATAFCSVGKAIAFGMWGCDRCLGCGEVRSLFGMWGAIAVGDVEGRSLLGMWRGESLFRNVRGR